MGEFFFGGGILFGGEKWKSTQNYCRRNAVMTTVLCKKKVSILTTILTTFSQNTDQILTTFSQNTRKY